MAVCMPYRAQGLASTSSPVCAPQRLAARRSVAPFRGRQHATAVRAQAAPKEVDVVVVGAGIAGLSCAATLQQAGVKALVLEAADGVGGRVRTDVQDGFLLDRGFQIFLTSESDMRACARMHAHAQPQAMRRLCL